MGNSDSQSALGVFGTSDSTSIHVTADACTDERMEVWQSMSVFGPLLLYICTTLSYQKKTQEMTSLLPAPANPS